MTGEWSTNTNESVRWQFDKTERKRRSGKCQSCIQCRKEMEINLKKIAGVGFGGSVLMSKMAHCGVFDITIRRFHMVRNRHICSAGEKSWNNVFFSLQSFILARNTFLEPELAFVSHTQQQLFWQTIDAWTTQTNVFAHCLAADESLVLTFFVLLCIARRHLVAQSFFSFVLERKHAHLLQQSPNRWIEAFWHKKLEFKINFIVADRWNIRNKINYLAQIFCCDRDATRMKIWTCKRHQKWK